MSETIPVTDFKDHQIIAANCTDGNGNEITIFLMDRSVHSGWADWSTNRKQAKPLPVLDPNDLKAPAENFLNGALAINPTKLRAEPFLTLPENSAGPSENT